MTPQELAERWAALPASTWLAGVAGSERHDVVIRWSWDHGWLAPLPCGVRWDALCMGDELGLAVLKALRATTDRPALGPVLHNRATGFVYWLLPVKASAVADWQQVDSTFRLLSGGEHLSVPDPEPEIPAPPLARWIHWPAVTGTLTPPDVLAAAVRQQLAPEEA